MVVGRLTAHPWSRLHSAQQHSPARYRGTNSSNQTLDELVEGLQSAKLGIMQIIQQDPTYTNNIADVGGAYDEGKGAAWLQIQKDLCEYVTIAQTIVDPVHHFQTTATTGFPVCVDAAGDCQILQLQRFFAMLEEFWHEPAALAVLMDHAAYTSSPAIPSVAPPPRKGMAAASPLDKLLISAAYLRETGGATSEKGATIERGSMMTESRRTLTPAGLRVHGKTTSRVDAFTETTDVSVSGDETAGNLSLVMREAMKSGARDMMDQLFEHMKDLHSHRRIYIALPHTLPDAVGDVECGAMPDDTLSISHSMGPADPRKGLATVVVTAHPGGVVGGEDSYTHVAMLDLADSENKHYTQRHFVASFIRLAKTAVAAKLGCPDDHETLDMQDFDTVKISPSMSFYWGVVAAPPPVQSRLLFTRAQDQEPQFNVGMLVHTLRHLPAGSSRAAPLVLPAAMGSGVFAGDNLAEWVDQRCDVIRSKNRFPSFSESWPPLARTSI